MPDQDRFHWARRVSRRDIQRLYESDRRKPVGENVIQGTVDQVRELIESLAGSTPGLTPLEKWRVVFYDPVRLFKLAHSHSEVQKIAARLGIQGIA